MNNDTLLNELYAKYDAAMNGDRKALRSLRLAEYEMAHAMKSIRAMQAAQLPENRYTHYESCIEPSAAPLSNNPDGNAEGLASTHQSAARTACDQQCQRTVGETIFYEAWGSRLARPENDQQPPAPPFRQA